MIVEMYKDFDVLNIFCLDVELCVIYYIFEIIVMVEKFIVNGYVYVVVDGDVMFDVEFFLKYGVFFC